MGDPPREKSSEIKKRVIKAREIQRKRFGCDKLNGNMTRNDIEKYCVLNDECKNILKTAVRSLNLSARSFDRILKTARTIADLENSKNIEKIYILEALSYRMGEE